MATHSDTLMHLCRTDDVRVVQGGCWLYVGPQDARGAGLMWWPSAKRRVSVARLKWSDEYELGIPGLGIRLTRLCDTVGCCNPYHQAPPRRFARGLPRGLSNAIRHELRAMYRPGLESRHGLSGACCCLPGELKVTRQAARVVSERFRVPVEAVLAIYGKVCREEAKDAA